MASSRTRLLTARLARDWWMESGSMPMGKTPMEQKRPPYSMPLGVVVESSRTREQDERKWCA